MEINTIIGKWFWVLFIVTMFANAGIFRYRAQRHIKENPDLAKGYAKIIKGFVLWGNIPWIIMGIGIVFGGVPSMFHFFRPRDGNPFVIAFFASVFLIWILSTFWLFFRNGAEMLIKHPGMFNIDFKSPLLLKLFWLLCLGGGIAGAIMMFTQNIPLPVK